MPMQPWFKLSRTATDETIDVTHYRSMVGSLRYLTHMRPNISYVVGYLSRFMGAPTSQY